MVEINAIPRASRCSDRAAGLARRLANRHLPMRRPHHAGSTFAPMTKDFATFYVMRMSPSRR